MINKLLQTNQTQVLISMDVNHIINRAKQQIKIQTLTKIMRKRQIFSQIYAKLEYFCQKGATKIFKKIWRKNQYFSTNCMIVVSEHKVLDVNMHV